MALKTMPLLEVPVPGRICWLCRHVLFSTAWGGTDVTPGDEFELACFKGYWRFDPYADDLGGFRAKLESAERCASFERRT